MILNASIPIDEVCDTLVSKLRQFFGNAGKSKAVVGLSGGLDSAVVVALACKALGAGNVKGIMMPSQFSTLHSISDAVDLANNLGIQYEVLPIEKIYNTYIKELDSFFADGKWSVAQENLQARIRANILMAYSNKFDTLLINTSNKSELCMGYGTLYGDLCGAIMVIADLYKMQVYNLANYINQDEMVIPQSIISKSPSAELHPGQKDSDSLPEYHILDPILFELNEGGKSMEQLAAQGIDKKLLKKIESLIKASAFKVHQLAPLIQISAAPLFPANKCI